MGAGYAAYGGPVRLGVMTGDFVTCRVLMFRPAWLKAAPNDTDISVRYPNRSRLGNREFGDVNVVK